jgi:hypothetical protein
MSIKWAVLEGRDVFEKLILSDMYTNTLRDIIHANAIDANFFFFVCSFILFLKCSVFKGIYGVPTSLMGEALYA